MKSKILVLALIVIFIMISLGSALAVDKGNARKGKYLFRKHCRTCHVEGGKAKEMSPIDHKQAEWEKIFTEAAYPCKADWPKLSDKDVADIYAHLYDHAADSPSPAKCK